MTSYGAYFIGFPKPAEATRDVTFTVKAGSTPLEGAVLTFRGNSAEGTDISGDYIAASARTTDASGQATVKLPDSGASGYYLTVSDTTVGDKTYTMKTSDKAGVKFDVASDKTTVSYVDMEELPTAYPITVKAFNEAGDEVSLEGATLAFGQSAAPVEVGAEKITGNTASFTTASSGLGLVLRLSGVAGYQNIIGDTAKINVQPVGSSITEAVVSTGDVAGAAAAVSVEDNGGNPYIKLVLKKTVTNVVIPVPVPKADGKNVTVEQAKQIRLTITNNKKTNARTVPEEGLVVSGDAIAVTADATDATLAGAIKATAALEDGAYLMAIGGPGFDAVEGVTLTVMTDRTTTPETRIVNVGGVPSFDEQGDVSGVEGGTTGSNKVQPDENGNGTVDLSGDDKDNTTITEGGDITVGGEGGVTVPQPSDPNVTDKTNDGLLDTEAGGGMEPSVVTDPLYSVVVENVKEGELIKNMTAKIYLVNATSSAGTFGMYYDPVVFDTASISDANLVLNDTELNIEFSSAMTQGGFKNPEIVAPTDTAKDGYFTFAWSTKQNAAGGGNTPVDATGGRKLIATITLPVRAQYWTESALVAAMDNRSIYTMEYDLTENGKKIITDAAGDDEILDNAMGASFRRITNTVGSIDSVHLDDSKATRGGFYQISAPAKVGTTTKNVQHDIRMEFEIPEIFTQQRADFYVTGLGDGADVDKATINIYENEFDPDAETAQTPIATLTTNETGRAHATLDPDKTYYYTVTHGSRWDYPDGTPQTDSDGLDCDSFLLLVTGASPKSNVVLQEDGTRVPTAVINDYINPRMAIKSFHEVKLDNGADPTPADPKVTLGSADKAYNSVDYKFTLNPIPGYEWKLADGETMDDVAAKLTAKLYDANADNTTSPFEDGTGTALTITWDTVAEQFVIKGNTITGDPIGVDTVGTDTVDPLRAGNIRISIPDEAVQFSESEITVTAGTGGTVSAKVDTTLTDGTSSITSDQAATSTITETLGEGRTTSAIFTFSPDTGKKIGKVVINGVEISLSEEQKKADYVYQFKNVTGDQTIYVTFVDAETEEELSDPAVTLVVGAKGKVTVDASTNPATSSEDVTGPATKFYEITADGSFTGVVTPDTGYEIDTVLIDGTAQTLTAGSDGFYKTYTVQGLDLSKGKTHTVAVTFKEEGGPSIQAIVTATVASGSGTLAPVGVTVYPMGATPTYGMTPDQYWTIKHDDNKSGAIIIDGVTDKSVNVVDNGDGTFSYTMEPLTGNTTLDVNFSEKTHGVQGTIQIQANVSDGKNVAAATLTFVRKAVAGATDETTITVPSSAKVVDNAGKKYLSFEADIPQGEWVVTVKKHGYLTYEIKEFKVDKDATEIIYFGDADSNGGTVAGDSSKIKPIQLIAGDAAGDGLTVAFDDVSMVVAGWIANALDANKDMSDLDENKFGNGGGSDTDDMSLVMNNMSQRRVRTDYPTFCATPTV